MVPSRPNHQLLLAIAGSFLALLGTGCPEEDAGCPDGQVECGGRCTDVASNVNHCGACGNVCDAGRVCSRGECVQTCQPWETLCSGLCVDTTSDPDHCGGCMRPCDPGHVCSYGQCAVSCLHPLSNCSGKCVDLDNDEQNCGGCMRPCDPGHVCSYGQCAVSCLHPLRNCSGQCVNLDTDRLNCGNCLRPCDAGEICAQGECTPSCGQGLTQCGDVCVDTDHDPEHCGGCFQACQPGQVCGGASGCQDPACPPLCPEGQTLCSGHCVDLAADALHCGACSHACAPDELCVAGSCSRGAFRIVSLDTQCWSVDDTAQLDVPRGPIAFGAGLLHYSGAALVLGYDFVGGYATVRSPVSIPTLTSDLASGNLWSLGDAQGLVQTGGTTVSNIVPLVASNQIQPGTPIALSEDFVLPNGSGLFAGHGRIGVHTGDELVLIDTETAAVTRLAAPALNAAACQGPFYSGILEQHADGPRLTYVQAGTDAVVRTRVSDGASQVLLQGVDFADMCGMAVNLAQSRWCFHLAEVSSQFDTQPGQSVAMCCEAVFDLQDP